MELKSFKRLSNGTILLEGVIWGTDPEKRIEVRDTETGYKAHSIKLENNWYYPYAVTAAATATKVEPVKP